MHAITALITNTVTDVYEPLEEGLDRVEIYSKQCVIRIVLTKNPSEDQMKSYGYMPPLSSEEVNRAIKEYENQGLSKQ